MTQDTPHNTIKKVNLTHFFFGYRKELGGVWGFGSFHACANSTAKMWLYYCEDGTLALL